MGDMATALPLLDSLCRGATDPMPFRREAQSGIRGDSLAPSPQWSWD